MVSPLAFVPVDLAFCLVGYVVCGEGSGASGFTYWREEGGGFVATTTICGEGVGVEQHGVRLQDERRMPVETLNTKNGSEWGERDGGTCVGRHPYSFTGL